MTVIKSHRDLDVWKLAMDFSILIYQISDKFPTNEKFGLSLQLRRASVSIPSNIAEGAARAHSKEFIQFLHISLGSLAEIETQLEIADRLAYFKQSEKHLEIIGRIRKMLIGLIKSLK